MHSRTGIALLAGLSLQAASLHADELRLRNGDRISGKILGKRGAELIVRTDYAGDLTVRWDQVRALITDAPIRLLAQGAREVVEVRLRQAGDGEVALEPAVDGRAALPLTRIAYLNPTPAESGEGIVFAGRINVAANYTRGNTESSRLYGEFDFAGAAKLSRFSLALRAEQQDSPGGTTLLQWRANADYDRFIAANRFLYARTSFEHDRFADIRLRSTIGGGHGWQVLDTANAALSLRTGLDYVEVRHRDTPNERFPALGLGIKFRHRPFARRIEFFHEQDGYLNLTRRRDLTLLSRTGLRIPILPGLHATAQLNADWDGDPPNGRKSLDTALLFGVGYEW